MGILWWNVVGMYTIGKEQIFKGSNSNTGIYSSPRRSTTLQWNNNFKNVHERIFSFYHFLTNSAEYILLIICFCFLLL